MANMTDEELNEKLSKCNSQKIKDALAIGWVPPTFEEVVQWWEDNILERPQSHIEKVLAIVAEVISTEDMLLEMFSYYEDSAEQFLKEDAAIKERGWKADKAESSTQQRFRKDMAKAGREVRFYQGRNQYEGWASKAACFDDIQEIIRATNVRLQWDQLGKTGYIVYPTKP